MIYLSDVGKVWLRLDFKNYLFSIGVKESLWFGLKKKSLVQVMEWLWSWLNPVLTTCTNMYNNIYRSCLQGKYTFWACHLSPQLPYCRKQVYFNHARRFTDRGESTGIEFGLPALEFAVWLFCFIADYRSTWKCKSNVVWLYLLVEQLG